MSSDGICVIENKNFVPFRIEFLNIVISKNNCKQVRIILDRIIDSSDPEALVDQVSDLPSGRVLWMIRFSAEAIFASSTSKSGVWIPLIEHEEIKSSTESTISTSLIHSIASVGNCEQVHNSVLSLIFQQANVAGVGNLSKWRSEICSRCCSAP